MAFFSRQRLRTRRVSSHKVRAVSEGGHRRGLGRVRVGPALLVTTLLVLAVVTLIMIGNPPLRYRRGETVTTPFYARTAFEYVDEERTERLRAAEEEKAPEIFRMDNSGLDAARTHIQTLLTEIQSASDLEVLTNKLAVQDNLFLPAESIPTLRTDLLKLEKSVIRSRLDKVFDHIAQQGLLDVESIPRERRVSPGLEVRVEDPVRNRSFSAEMGSYLTPQTLAPFVRTTLSNNLDATLLPVVEPLVEYLARSVQPTLVHESEASRELVLTARQRIPAQIVHVTPGVLLLPVGSFVGYSEETILRAEQEAFQSQFSGVVFLLKRLIGVFLLVWLTFGLGLGWLLLGRPNVVRSGWQLLTIAGLILLVVAAARLTVQLRAPSPYLIPLSFLTIVLAMAHNRSLALGVSVFTLVPLSLAIGADYSVLVVLLMGAVVASLLTVHIKRRSKLIVVGVLVGLTQAATVWGLGLLSLGQLQTLLPQSFWALANGVAVGFLVTGMLPFLERALGITTDISLLELADLNQPVLSSLALDAPGSYNHSLAVGVLAEAAAQAIGADELLARLGAYYHDIGKLNKPQYFIENGPAATKLHEHLSPSMSTLIITAHVKDGLEMAEDLGLPHPLRDIIAQHHGTTTVRFFLKKARQQHPDTTVPDQDFRYSGPLPRSREAAVVMLADAVESAARTLHEPSPGNLEGLVHELTQQRLSEGQFDQCNITLGELGRVEYALIRGLASIYHARVHY